MRIGVELLSGEKQWVTVEADATVESVVSKLSLATDSANTGSFTGQGRSIALHFGEKTLSAASALHTYGIKDESTLHELADDTRSKSDHTADAGAGAREDEPDAVTVDSASGGGGGGGGQEHKSNETGALTLVAPAMMVSCIFNRNWSDLSVDEQTHAVVEIGEAVKTSQCEAGVMLARLIQAHRDGFLPVPALISLTAAVSCAQTTATGAAVKQHVTRSTSTITDRIYKLLCARERKGTGINQQDFLNDLFRVGREDSESTERTLLLEYCVFDNEHPTAPELAAARNRIVAVLRKMKRKLIDVHTGSNRRDSVITVPVEKRDRAGGGISSTSKSKDGGGKSSSNSKKDRRAGDGTKSPDCQEDGSAPKKRKQNPLATRPAISSEDESDDCSDDDHDDVSGGGGNHLTDLVRSSVPADGVSDFLHKDELVEVMDCHHPRNWYQAVVHTAEEDSRVTGSVSGAVTLMWHFPGQPSATEYQSDGKRYIAERLYETEAPLPFFSGDAYTISCAQNGKKYAVFRLTNGSFPTAVTDSVVASFAQLCCLWAKNLNNETKPFFPRDWVTTVSITREGPAFCKNKQQSDQEQRVQGIREDIHEEFCCSEKNGRGAVARYEWNDSIDSDDGASRMSKEDWTAFSRSSECSL